MPSIIGHRIGQRFAFFVSSSALVALVTITGLVRPAQASPVSARELEARKDFAAGRFTEAVDIFAELFAQTADPVFLRNIARCHQKMNHVAEAIDNFREYLRKAKKLAPGERAEVEGYIRDLESSRESRPPATAATPPEPAPAAPPTPKPAAPPEPIHRDEAGKAPAHAVAAPAPAPAAAPVEVPPIADQTSPRPRTAEHDALDTGRSVSVAAVVVTSVGAALVGAGVYFSLATQSAGKSLATQYDPDLERAGRRDATLQWVGYGLGAVALTTGVVMLVRGPTPASSGEVAALRLGIGPRGAVVEGRF